MSEVYSKGVMSGSVSNCTVVTNLMRYTPTIIVLQTTKYMYPMPFFIPKNAYWSSLCIVACLIIPGYIVLSFNPTTLPEKCKHMLNAKEALLFS